MAVAGKPGRSRRSGPEDARRGTRCAATLARLSHRAAGRRNPASLCLRPKAGGDRPRRVSSKRWVNHDRVALRLGERGRIRRGQRREMENGPRVRARMVARSDLRKDVPPARSAPSRRSPPLDQGHRQPALAHTRGVATRRRATPRRRPPAQLSPLPDRRDERHVTSPNMPSGARRSAGLRLEPDVSGL